MSPCRKRDTPIISQRELEQLKAAEEFYRAVSEQILARLTSQTQPGDLMLKLMPQVKPKSQKRSRGAR